MLSSIIGRVMAALNRAIPENGDVVENSPNCMLMATGGRRKEKSIALAGSGAQTENLFVVTGVVEILELHLYATTVTDSTTLSALKFEVDDGTAQTDITGTVDASGIVANGMVYKRGLLATAAVMLSPTAGMIAEASANKVSFEPFLALEKTGGVATYIRLSYTGDANTDVAAKACIRYRPHSSNGTVEAV